HILTGRGGPRVNLNKILTSYMGQPHEIQMTLATLIFSGILERFPKLQIVSAENDVSWLYHFMYRIRSPLKLEEMLFLSYGKWRHEERAAPASGIVGPDPGPCSSCAVGRGGRLRAAPGDFGGAGRRPAG